MDSTWRWTNHVTAEPLDLEVSKLPRYEALADGAAVIMIAGELEAELLADLDLARLGRAQPVEGMKLYVQAVNERRINWMIAAHPTAGQARQVFGEPDVDRLWGAVARAVRLEAADPVAAWHEHLEKPKEPDDPSTLWRGDV